MILIADDDKRIIETLRRPLEKEGYRVQGVANGIEAYQLLRSPDCSFLLLDVNMPQLDGGELLELMHKEHLRVPTAVMSGGDSPDKTVVDRFPFVTAFLGKPVDLAELVQLLKDHVRLLTDVRIVTCHHTIRGRIELPENTALVDYLAQCPPFLEIKNASVTDTDGQRTLTAASLLVAAAKIESVVPSEAVTGGG